MVFSGLGHSGNRNGNGSAYRGWQIHLLCEMGGEWPDMIDGALGSQTGKCATYYLPSEMNVRKAFERGRTSLIMMGVLRASRLRLFLVSILSRLDQLWDYDAINPQDKLFTLLGLSIETGEPLLRHNYTESLSGALKRHAAYFVTQLGYLELRYDDRRYEFTDLPSWIPKWYSSVFKRGRLLAPGSMVWERVADPAMFCAVGHSKVSMRLLNETADLLSIRGILVSQVAHMGKIYQTKKIPELEANGGIQGERERIRSEQYCVSAL